MREHVRTFMAAAFVLDAIASTRRTLEPPAPRPAPDVETDWNPAALAIRTRRAMSRREPVRLRLHDGSTRTGLIGSLLDHQPERRGTTLAIAFNYELVHLADVAAVGPAARRAPRERRAPRLAACAHAFGYRGRCLTKSRRYSTTFKQLRADREAYVHAQILARSRDATQRALAGAIERTVALDIDGIGHVTAADGYLAAKRHAEARERRRIGREERDADDRWRQSITEGGTR